MEVGEGGNVGRYLNTLGVLRREFSGPHIAILHNNTTRFPHLSNIFHSILAWTSGLRPPVAAPESLNTYSPTVGFSDHSQPLPSSVRKNTHVGT